MQDIFAYSHIIRQLRRFFQDHKGYIEVPAQPRLSILAACEDPETITQFVFSGVNYPLPQTGQMWLESEILKNPDVPGVFCITTSYRNEPFPIPGRHDKIFPMFEFESAGSINELKKVEAELLEYLGFPSPVSCRYDAICQKYETFEIKSDHEMMLQQELGNVISLEHFPQRTHPFWNMKHNKNGIFNKVDVILYGMETIGSAERSSNVDEMRENFFTISNGQYAKLLFNAFGKDRVTKELDEYLSLPMFPRFGGGIGITRLARAMKLAEIIPADKEAKTELAKAI
ncbi:MAG: TRNA ligase [uncultured bacterium]|nr:MAG: TRNA ligase [uncultured bacterium]